MSRMSYIVATVIVVLFYLLTPMSGETLFKCQGENVTLGFEKTDFHDGTVTWYKNLTDGNTELIAYKVGDKDPIVSAPFYHYAEIDRDLNLILRNVSSESSGEYFRRIINGGIYNSIVNLYVMCAPSGKPIVTIERKDNGTDSVQYELPPNLGNPKANLAIELLETIFTEDGSNSIMQQYEICLIGNSIQCFEGSPCQNYTIQSSFVQKLRNSTDETLFKCQGENVTLEFEKIDFHDGTVTWHKDLTDGNTELIAYKVEDKDPIVSAPFSHYAEIDRDLNLLLRNISSELNGEYLRRIVNGGIFNSSVNLYVMRAPSSKPIVTIERKENGTDSVQYDLPPDLGNPKANLAIELLETLFTENGSNSIMLQYEICLIGNSIQCFECSPCQKYTIQSSFVQRLKICTEHEDANKTFLFVPFYINSLIMSTVIVYILEGDSLEKKSFLGHLKTVITQRRIIFGSTVVLIVITIVLWQYSDSLYSSGFLMITSVTSFPTMLIIVNVRKAKNRKQRKPESFVWKMIAAIWWDLCNVFFMLLTNGMWYWLKTHLDRNLSLSLSIGVPILIHLGLTVIFIQRLKKKIMYRYRVTRPKTGNSDETEELLIILTKDNAEKQNCEVDNGDTDTEMNHKCVDNTDQNDDVKPGCSHSL